MKDIFTLKLHLKVRPNDILVKNHGINTITYGTKSLKNLGVKCGTDYQKTSNQRYVIPNLRNILTLGLDLKVDVMSCVHEYLKLYQLKCVLITCRRAVMYFNVFTGVLAQI